jgi:hypothetical protein
LISALDGGECSASRPGRPLPPGKETPQYPLVWRLGGPRAGLDAGAGRKILHLCRGSNPTRPVQSDILTELPQLPIVVVIAVAVVEWGSCYITEWHTETISDVTYLANEINTSRI